MPATTCALVITRSGAATKPLPSSCREHDGALPRILTTRSCTCRTTGLLCNAGSGGPTSVTGVLPNGPSTSGNPESESNRRSWSGRERAAAGITESTARSTPEPFTAETRPGKLADASGSAISQAAMTTVIACTTAPSVESTRRLFSLWMRFLMRRPKKTPVVSPRATSSTTTVMLATTFVVWDSMP